jgi:hypothetical protein
MLGAGGMMGAAIQADRREQPSRGPMQSYDPLTAAHVGGAGPYRGFSFP